MCVCASVCDINPHHLRHRRRHTVLQLLPSLKGLVPSVKRNLPKLLETYARSTCGCWKGKKDHPVLVFCFDWGCSLCRTVLASWLSFLFPTLLLSAPHPPRLADAATHPSLCTLHFASQELIQMGQNTKTFDLITRQCDPS